MSNEVFKTRSEVIQFLTDYYLGAAKGFESNWVGSNFNLTVGRDKFE